MYRVSQNFRGKVGAIFNKVSWYFEATPMIFWDFTLGHLIISIHFKLLLTFLTTTTLFEKQHFFDILARYMTLGAIYNITMNCRGLINIPNILILGQIMASHLKGTSNSFKTSILRHFNPLLDPFCSKMLIWGQKRSNNGLKCLNIEVLKLIEVASGGQP